MENRIEMEKPGPAHAAREVKATGCCGHHNFEKATEVLSDEHRVIERVLAVVEKLAAATGGGTPRQLEAGARFYPSFCRRMPPSKRRKDSLSGHGGARHTEGRRSNRYDADGTRRGEKSREVHAGGADACGNKKRGGQGYPSQPRKVLRSPFEESTFKRRMTFSLKLPMTLFLPMSKNSCCDPSKSMRPRR